MSSGLPSNRPRGTTSVTAEAGTAGLGGSGIRAGTAGFPSRSPASISPLGPPGKLTTRAYFLFGTADETVVAPASRLRCSASSLHTPRMNSTRSSRVHSLVASSSPPVLATTSSRSASVDMACACVERPLSPALSSASHSFLACCSCSTSAASAGMRASVCAGGGHATEAFISDEGGEPCSSPFPKVRMGEEQELKGEEANEEGASI